MATPCPCCVAVPTQQFGPCNNLKKNSDVLDWLHQYRQHPGNLRKPLQDIMCGASATSLGGSRCREEGGCQNRPNQCITYFISAPYYQANIPFLVSNKEIKQNIEKLLCNDRAIKKLGGSPAAIQKKAKHQQYLEDFFPALSANVKGQLQTCPARYFSSC